MDPSLESQLVQPQPAAPRAPKTEGIMSRMRKNAYAVVTGILLSMPMSYVEAAKKTAANPVKKPTAAEATHKEPRGAMRYNPKTKKMERVTEEMKKKERREYLMRLYKNRLDNPKTPLSDEERTRIRKGLEDGTIDPETLEVPAPITEPQEEPIQQPQPPLGENNTAEVEKDTDAIRHIERNKDGTWVIDYHPAEKSGEGLRGPSAYPIEERYVTAVTNEVIYDVERRGKNFRLESLEHLVQNVGEICNLRTKVFVTTDGTPEKNADVYVITSGRNQSLWLKIQGESERGKGTIHIRMDQYISMPRTRSNVIAGLQTNPHFLQLAAIRQQVHNQGQNELANGNPFSTCYVRASAIEKLSNAAAATIVGEWKGHRHAWNMSGGNLIFDSAAGDYIGPENLDFIPTSSGHLFKLPDGVMKGEKQRILDIGKGEDSRYIYTGGRIGNVHTEFSTPNYGSRQAQMIQAQQNIPDDVKEIFEKVRAEREAVNAGKIAQK